jgi:radical SAM superfamily enzyme YgiQ (UPF0313 family)
VTDSIQLHPSPALVVAITQGGVAVPGFEGVGAVELDLAGLLLLERLSVAGAGESDAIATELAGEVGIKPERLLDIVARLRDRDLLLDAEVRQADLRPSTVLDPAGPLDCEPGDVVMLETPVVVRVGNGAFEASSHDGAVSLSLDAMQLAAATHLRVAGPWDAALERHRGDAGDLALDDAGFRSLLGQLSASGMLQVVDPDRSEFTAQGLSGIIAEKDRAAQALLAQVIERRMVDFDAAEREREGTTGQKRAMVVPVAFNYQPPLALGLIFAFAKAFDGGRLQEHYAFRPDWVIDTTKIAPLTERPGVYLFSNYLWSSVRCAEISKQVKALSPGSVTIHGGPDTPKYRNDAERYFRENPDVDVTVRGEGEATTAAVLDALIGALGVLDGGRTDFSVLRDVEGISFRDGEEIVHNPDRDRIADLDTIPSPFLTGLFDAYGEVPRMQVTTETNRGCPYGCTFCDWGSATMSRIRKFSIDRVFAELEWLSSHKMMAIGPADSNFGMLERDVDIAEKIAELKALNGYPKVFGVSYAKNTVRHLRKIIQLMADAGILTHGILSLQSMDEETLAVIERTNIKLEKYEELAGEFRRAGLPLFVDLMVGLPGATHQSFLNDLQQCVDREVQVRLPITELLVNSPMNDPAYKEKYKIVVTNEPGRGQHSMVVSTSSFGREEYHEMRQTRLVFLLCENFNVLRQVARYVRQETGMREVDFYELLRVTSRRSPETWPAIAVTMLAGPELMVPPGSWRDLLDEVHRFVVTEMGVIDDSGLAAILAAQHALLPARDRTYPATVELAHDFVGWHRSMVEAKEAGHHDDWPDVVAPLRSFPPALLTVDDPARMATIAMGAPIESHGFGTNWELVSPVARAFILGKERAEEILSA